MLTMPRKYILPGPRGERRRTCDYCGIKWHQSDLRQDAAGYWACPDDQSGRDVVTLDRMNANTRIHGGIPVQGTVRDVTGHLIGYIEVPDPG